MPLGVLNATPSELAGYSPNDNNKRDLIFEVKVEELPLKDDGGRHVEPDSLPECPEKYNSELDNDVRDQNGELTVQLATRPRFREGGWGWVCVASIFVMNVLMAGPVNVFSLISIELQIRYGISTQAAGWVYSIYMVLFMLSGPLCSVLCKKYSCRSVALGCAFSLTVGILCLAYAPNIFMVYLGYSILGGLSSGMHSLVGVLVIGEYFNEKRGKATGLAHSGKSIGQMLYAPLFSFLFLYYGYQGAILLVSGIILHIFVCGALLRSPRTKHLIYEKPPTSFPLVDDAVANEPTIDVKASTNFNHEKRRQNVGSPDPDRKDDATTARDGHDADSRCLTNNLRRLLQKINSLIDLALLKDPMFMAYGALLSSINSMSNSFYNSCLAGIVKDKQFSRDQVALLISLAGGLGCLAKVAGGFIIDFRMLRPNRIHLSMAMYLIPTLMLLLIPLIDNKILLFVFWLLFTMGSSFVGSQSSVIMVDVVGVTRHASALGLSMPFRGLGILLGPPLGGYLRDVTHNYSTSLFACGTLNLVAIFVVEVMVLFNKRKLDKIRKENFAK